MPCLAQPRPLDLEDESTSVWNASHFWSLDPSPHGIAVLRQMRRRLSRFGTGQSFDRGEHGTPYQPERRGQESGCRLWRRGEVEELHPDVPR